MDWQGFQFYELIQVPKPDRVTHDKQAAGGTDPLAASLTGSHTDLRATGTPGAALATAWVRGPDEQTLHILFGGRPCFPPAIRSNSKASTQALLFPPGALAASLSTQDVDGLLKPFRYWVPCVARPDALWGNTEDKNKSGPATARRGSFDRQVAHLRGPFAWLIVAEPLPPQALDPELQALVNEILPLSRGEVGQAKRVELERKQARHRELSRARLGGGWRVRVLVGSVDPAGAGTAAAMLCAASELGNLPYVLEPAGLPATAPDFQNAFVSGTDLLVALTRPPERELPGLRLVQPHSFDVTPDVSENGGLRLGGVLDEARVEVTDLVLGRNALNRHTFVCGATGAGKSQTVRHLLTEASRAGLPWLVVEPAKAEYARMSARLAALGQDVVVIRPGDPECAPAGFNPLEPAPGFPLQTHVDLLRALFLAAFEPFEPFPQVLAAALARCYEELSWDLTLSEPAGRSAARYPTLSDLERVAAMVVGEIGYGQQVAADVHGFIKVRLSSLRLGTTGRFFEGGHPLDFERLHQRNVVFEIQDVGDDADKAFLMGAILMRLTEHLRVREQTTPSKGLTHLTVIEEAHRLLRRAEPGSSGPAAHAVEMFAALLAEVRAYGEGLVIAEQIPSKLTTDVIKNTAVKIVHRLPAEDDRESVGATMNLDEEQSRYVVTLVPGEAAVFSDGMDRPLLVRMPDGTAVEEAGGQTTAPVNALIRSRSATCGVDCHAEPCTLRSMRAARHLLDDQPWLTAWAELTVLAHLAGHDLLRPVPAQLRGLAPHLVNPRVLDCALSHAVDDAVAVRSAVLQPTVGHADLAAHCVAALGTTIAGQPYCADTELDFLADVYKWAHLKHLLEQESPHGPVHPDTPRLERRFGRPIPGQTRADQLRIVEGWWAESFADRARRDAVTYGTRRPSVLEGALGGGAGTPGWELRLANALGPFEVADWPLSHLINE